MDEIDAMMREHERAAKEAEAMLRGDNQRSDVSPELAWAERILRQNRTDAAGAASAPVVMESSARPSSAEVSMSRSDALRALLASRVAKPGAQAQSISSSPTSATARTSSSASTTSSSSSRGAALLTQLRDPSCTELSAAEVAELVEYLHSLASIDKVADDNDARSGTTATTTQPPNVASGASEPAAAKEARFAAALSSTRELMGACGFAPEQWFLACGTALGYHREGRFIAHDNDIDIGVMYPATGVNGDGDSDAASAHDPFLRLLTETSTVIGRGELVCFETLGSLHYGGFQLRLLHVRTQVMVDINVYYRSPVDPATGRASIGPSSSPSSPSAASAQSVSDRIWFATFYEDAARRRHGMYRYDFSCAALAPRSGERKSFYGAQYTVPCERYLDEYFGEDWRTPKAYTYEEGIAQQHYRNIIPE